MFPRCLIVAFLVLLLAGCATTGKNANTQTSQQLQNQVQELQARVSFLEEELQSKDQEISYLEGETEKTPSTESSSQNKTASNTKVTLSIGQVQTALKNADFYKGPVDGKMGPETKSAIKKFQKAKSLIADGFVGQKTALALSKYLTK